MIRRAGAGLLALALLVAVPAAPAQADDEPVVEVGARVGGTPEPDGRPVELDVSLFTSDPGAGRPAIVLAHGFGGSKTDSAEPARTLAAAGYTVITFTARGFGASGGRIHLDNPAFEGADMRRIIDFAVSRPEVAKAGNDPVIGVAGASYGGAAAILAAGLDPRVDAIVSAFTWNSLVQSLIPQYLVRTPQSTLAQVEPDRSDIGVYKRQWSALFFSAGGGGAAEGDNPLCGRFAAGLCALYNDVAATGIATPALITELAQSDLDPLLAEITAPTLIIAGESDTLFPLDQADANYRGLPAGTPRMMSWVQGGHDGAISLDELMPQLETWFDRYLEGDGSTTTDGFSVVVPQAGLVGRGNEGVRDPATYLAPAYPGSSDRLPTQRLALSGGIQPVLSPAGAIPGALTNLPGTGGALAEASTFAGYSLAVLPGQSATFSTAALADPIALVGSGRVRLRITSSSPDAVMFASLWDLGPDVTTSTGSGPARTGPGSAVLPGLGVAPVRLTGLTPGTPTDVEIALPPVSHQVPVGHRLQVVLASTDQAYATPTRPAFYQVALAAPDLVLPRLVAERVGAGRVDVPLPLLIGVSALVLAAIAAMTVFTLRRRSAHPRPDLADRPLMVEDLVKTYKGGVKAVAGVSFGAESGQVVGLLGPNGAGKTTVMRMLVGLIRPDSGSIHLSGEPVHAGADVLNSVGAFIEGPGFLPHLSGMENLRAYWAATGRPPEEAHLDEALAIAGLGTAIDRRVRGYSHGMRQRLGIAQAMLGLPSILLLDEPTNGLDPPQIKMMRMVLADYAATGRTVVVSSHLLSEVQQTCTHVVVMHQGRVILTGSMAELTATEDVTLLGLAEESDRGLALEVLRGLGLQTAMDGTTIKVTGPLARSRLVAHLVEAGVELDSVDGHRQLEEVFMSLVEPEAAER